MSTPISGDLTCRRRVLVADEDPKIVEFIVQTLWEDGFAVFYAYDGLSAAEPAFALDLPTLYIANIDRSTPAIEPKLLVVRDSG